MSWARLGVGLLAFVGCGGGGPGIPRAQIEAEWHRAICGTEVRCGRMPSVDACLGATSSPVSAQLAADLESGKVAYDAHAGKALVEWEAAMPCGLTAAASRATVQGTQRHVAAAFRGRVSPGDACGADEQCAAPALCDRSTSSGVRCGGKCTVPPAPKHVGASCSSGSGAVVYTTVPLCDDSSYCSGPPGAAVCTPLPTSAGAPCEGPGGCGGGLACVPTATLPDGACAALASPGATCDPTLATPCDDPTTYCDPASKTCLPRLAVGARCDVADSSCAAFAACDPVASVCTPVAGPGQDCQAFGIECLGDLGCATPTTPCALPPQPAACP